MAKIQASETWHAPLLLLGGMALFGSATPLSKLVGQSFPPMLAGLLRVRIGGVILMLLARKHWPDIREIENRDWLALGLIALFGMFGFSALMLYGMQRSAGVIGATVMAMTPAVTAAGSILFLKERPSWRKLVSIGLAVVGAATIALANGFGVMAGGANLLGAGLVFLAICCEAAYTLIGQRATRTVDPVLAAALAAVMAVPLFAAAAWFTGELRPVRADGRGWTLLVVYSAGTLAIGSWLWYRGIARVSGVTAAAFMGVMPLTALVLSYVLLQEPFRWVQAVGFAIVFAGVLLMSWEHARHDGDG